MDRSRWPWKRRGNYLCLLFVLSCVQLVRNGIQTSSVQLLTAQKTESSATLPFMTALDRKGSNDGVGETYVVSSEPRNLTQLSVTSTGSRRIWNDTIPPISNKPSTTLKATSKANVSPPLESDTSSTITTTKDSINLTAAQHCRLALIEKYYDPMIDNFLNMGEANPPFINWVWDFGGNEFWLDLNMDSLLVWKKHVLRQANWWWKDQFGATFPAKIILQGAKHFFYLRGPNATSGTERPIPHFFWFDNVTLPENKTIVPWVYDLRPIIECDHLELAAEERPSPTSKIGICSKFAGNHALLPPYIAYHKLIGVQHFWIYMNERIFNITDLPQDKYITYVPYSLTMAGRPRISGMKEYARPGGHFFQHDVQNQCLYRAKRYGLDWIITNDSDEYLWINKFEHEADQFPPRLSDDDSNSSSSSSSSSSILATFLQPYEKNPKWGSVLVRGWAFGAPNRQNLTMPIDMTVRAASPCGGKDKHIYRVPVALDIGVHWLFSGGTIASPPIEFIRWNHYRRNPPHDKQIVYQFHKAKNQTLVEDTSLKDKYQSAIRQWIDNHRTPQATRASSTQQER